jgi:APA family basic amino acid/polyamine antiporter
MAEDGILPPIFKKVNSKTQVQEFGMSFFVAMTLVILFFVDSFSKLLRYVMFFDTIGLSIAALAIFILRKKTKDIDTSGLYTIKWFPLIPVIFILSYWFVTINIFVTFRENPYAALICLGCYALGLIIYYGSTYRKRKSVN